MVLGQLSPRKIPASPPFLTLALTLTLIIPIYKEKIFLFAIIINEFSKKKHMQFYFQVI